MEEDWDVPLLLDACWYDLFVERNSIEGNLGYRYSLGLTSEEFPQRNFGNDTFHDTVYVNANPYVPYLELDDSTFHAVVDLLGEWDEDTETVMLKTVADAALSVGERFPNKRLIVHFMQPHTPFISKTGRQIGAGGWPPTREGDGLDSLTVWQRLRRYDSGDDRRPDTKQVWEAYRENTDIVLEHAANFVGGLDRMTVIAADHGNMIGERLWPAPTRRMYGHPYGVYHPSLMKVPWLRVESEHRRKVVTEPPVASDMTEDEVTEQRLEAFGYK